MCASVEMDGRYDKSAPDRGEQVRITREAGRHVAQCSEGKGSRRVAFASELQSSVSLRLNSLDE